MKIFILGNVPDKAERLTDALGNYDVNVVSREIEGDIESLESEVSKVVGRADSVVFVTRDPIKATMDLNKMSGISAAQCVSGSDINSARRNGANVIVMGSGANVEDFAEYLAGGGKQEFSLIKPRKIVAQDVQKPAQRLVVAKKVQQKVAQIQKKMQAAKTIEPEEKEDKYEEEYEEAEGESDKRVKGGFLGRIKHSLGIMDSDEHEEEEE